MNVINPKNLEHNEGISHVVLLVGKNYQLQNVQSYPHVDIGRAAERIEGQQSTARLRKHVHFFSVEQYACSGGEPRTVKG